MTNAAAKLFISYLEAKEMKYSVVNEERAVIRVGWNLEGTTLGVFFMFDENGTSVHIEGHDFLTFTKDKCDKMYKICNDLNRKYRWVKFTVDVEKSVAVVECDAVIQLDTCAEEAVELMLRMTNIVEDAYPIIMKALWA